MSKSLFSYFKKTPKKESPSLKKLETPKSRSEETKRKNNDEISKREFVEGDIVRAKLNDFPYWPGMICLDPKKNVSMVKEKGITKFHVQFFGDPPTHDLVDKSYIKEFKDMKPDEKDKEQQVAYKQAECAINIPPSERVEKLYACIDSSEDDDEAMTSDKENLTENEEDVLAQSRKRSRTSANGKPRKRMKMIDSDSEDDSGNDSTYKPDENDASDDDDYKSDSQMESESPIDNDDSDHESPPKKKKSLSTPKPIKGKSTVKNISSPITPLSNKKMNSSISSPITPLSSKKINASISNVQSKLSQFSSPGANTSSSDLTIDTELTYTHMKLSFLEDGKRKDKRGKLHTHPEYDPRTLCVPDSYINSKEVTPGMKQWWTLKRDLYDTIIFFKVGKFYELYHMDAVVGVKELGLTYMKGKFAHCGFPEIAFSRYSEVLVQRGFKVARIEQTETPQTMSERSAKVVRREVCAIISKGTRTFSFMEGATDETTSAYLLSIVEKPCNDICLGGSLFGVCFVDTSIGKFYIGQFKDDRQCSRFLTMVAQYPPVQVLYQRGGISAKLNHIMNHELITTIKEVLHPGTEFWDSSKTLKHFHDNDYFTDENSNASIAWPPILKQMIAEGDTLGLAASEEYEHAVSALGACTWYLNKCQIAEELISMQKFEEFVPTDNLTKRVQKNSMAKYMILDGVTLTNLDIVINNDGNTNGTLLELLDHCATPFGKRFFKQWLCSPLCQKSSIENRLNAVEDLMKCSSLINECRNIMRSLPDLERILRRIHSLGSVKRSKDHPDSRAIMYNEETYSKKKISDLISAFEGFNKTYKVMKMFEENIDSFSSSSFKRLLLKNDRNDIGMFPDLLPSLKFYQHAFNHKVAKETGLIHPKAGVVVEYDRALAEIDCIKEKLNDYLKQQKKRMSCNSIVYWGTGKNRYQLEIPEAALRSHTPNDYHLKSQKKGYKRYQSNIIESLVEELTRAEEKRDCALKDTMREIFHKFDSEYPMWEKAVSCLATIDCLMSLAYYSLNIDGVSCRPEIVDLTTDDGDDVRPFFELINCRHPCITLSSGDDFIPNDIILGKSEENEETGNSEKPASCLLITGPNMGGKSTLMRQTGVILIMAQLGCYVPAEVCRFTPVDRVFTRLGARDRILHGESTFFVELSETSVIFQHATKHSLVLLDELGRGTATYDGTAIASAVVHELSKTIGCRTLFSTHYHTLVEEFANAENIKLGHMACMVEKEDDTNDDDDPSTDTITFLYKFAHGACPKSYGFNAAKLAGLPISVIKSAHEKAKEFEKSTVNMRKLRSILHCNVSDITKMMTSLVT